MHLSQWFSSGKVKCWKDVISKDKHQTVFKGSLFPLAVHSHFLPCTEVLVGLPVNRYSSSPDRKLTHDKMHQFSARWVRWISSQGSTECCSWQRCGALWTGAGEERRPWAKCSSCLWKCTVKQQVNPTLLTVILLQALSCTSVATITLKCWHTLCARLMLLLCTALNQFATLRN